MKAVQFYRSEIANNDGTTFEDILAYSYGALEVDHSYIQWLFPLYEPSCFNVLAPVLTTEEQILFSTDPFLRDRVEKAFHKMLDFYGLQYSDEVVSWQVPGKHENPQWWLEFFNHNMLRITRILMSLRLLGRTDLCMALYKLLLTVRNRVTQNTWDYWNDAALN